MNALATLRRNRTRRANARARAAFWREASAWAGVAMLALVGAPGAIALGYAFGASLL